MKKIAILAAMLAAFSFVSCEKEINPIDENTPVEKQKITVNISVGALSDEPGTRAIKKNWAEGDKVNIWFDNAYWTVLPQLVLTYTGNSWTASDVDESVLQETGGTLKAVYEASNSMFNTTYNSQYADYPENLTRNPDNNLIVYNTVMTCYANNLAYSYNQTERTLSGTITWKYATTFQVVVTGLENNNPERYMLKCKHLQKIGSLAYSSNNGIAASSTGNNKFTGGVSNEDGVAFYFMNYSQNNDYTFELYDTETQMRFSYTPAIESPISENTSKCYGIKLNFSKFNPTINGHAYVDMGEAGKWATMNVGASRPEDYGDFYAWGEVTTRSDYSASNGISSSFADAATVWWGEGWRTPTYSELNKLCQTDSFTWEWDSSIKCYKVTCKANNNSILLPAAGYRNGTTHDRFGTQGFYWSSEKSGESASCLFFNSTNDTHIMGNNSCSFGQPIRPIVAE